MVDWVVVLTPLLVLGVVLLLGFAGCKFEPGVIPAGVVLRVRVPMALNVTRVVFRYTPPAESSMAEIRDNPTPDYTEDSDNVYAHRLEVNDARVGPWMTACRVTVDGTEAGAPGDFVVESADSYVLATWQATGTSPAELAVSFTGAL